VYAIIIILKMGRGSLFSGGFFVIFNQNIFHIEFFKKMILNAGIAKINS